MSIISEDLKSLENGIDWTTFPDNKINDAIALRYKEKLNPTLLIKNGNVSVDVLIKILKCHLKNNKSFYGSTYRFKLSEFFNYGADDLEKIIDSDICDISVNDYDIGKLAISDSIVEKCYEKLPSLSRMVSAYSRTNLSYSSIVKLTKNVNDKMHYVLFDSIKNNHSLLLELFDVIWVNSLINIETDNVELSARIADYRNRIGDSVKTIDMIFMMISNNRVDEYNRYGGRFLSIYGLTSDVISKCALPLYVIKHMIHWTGKTEILYNHVKHVDITGIDDYDFEPDASLLKGNRGDDTYMNVDEFNDIMRQNLMYTHYKFDKPVFNPVMVKKYPNICDEVCLEWFKDMSADTLIDNWSLFNHDRLDDYSYKAEYASIYVYVHCGENIDHRILDKLFNEDKNRTDTWYDGWNYQYCMSTEDLRVYRSKVKWKQLVRYRDITELEMVEFIDEIRTVFNSDVRWKIGHDIHNPNFFKSNCEKFDELRIKIKKVDLNISIPADMCEIDAKNYLYNLYKNKATNGN